LLINYGIDVYAVDMVGRTAIDIAREKNFYEILSILKNFEKCS